MQVGPVAKDEYEAVVDLWEASVRATHSFLPDEDIEYYIKECGDILGVSSQVNHPDDPKAILHYIFQEIVKYKSSNLS